MRKETPTIKSLGMQDWRCILGEKIGIHCKDECCCIFLSMCFLPIRQMRSISEKSIPERGNPEKSSEILLRIFFSKLLYALLAIMMHPTLVERDNGLWGIELRNYLCIFKETCPKSLGGTNLEMLVTTLPA